MKEYLICSAFGCVFTLILCAFGKAVKREQSCICDMVQDMVNLILIDTGYPR